MIGLAVGVIFLLLLPGLLLAVAEIVIHVRERTRLHRQSQAKTDTSRSDSRFLFLVPAHNEEDVIGDCVRSLNDIVYPRNAYQSVVIADNCTDQTAETVRSLGVDCIERTDRSNRGKPYALSWAIDRLDLSGFDYVVIVDADTTVAPSVARALDDTAVQHPDDHLQAYYGLSNIYDSWLTILSDLLIRIRYEAMFPRRERAGLNCPLTGNGMCFQVEYLQKHGWQFFSLTEDWEAYAALTYDGESIRFVEEAKIFAQETETVSQSTTRRQRWLAGCYGVLAEWCIPLLRSREITAAQKLDAISELAYPGPVLHANLVVAAITVATLFLSAVWTSVIAGVGVATLAPLIVPAIRLTLDSDNSFRILKAGAFLPIYAVWRAGLGVATIFRAFRGLEWQKTERRDAPPRDD